MCEHSGAVVPYSASTEMMSRDRHSPYQAVTVRWKELEVLSPSGRLFVASYSIAAEDGTQGRSHELPTQFHSLHAAAHALSQARLSIDASLSA
jgi:hypothetical protein